MDMKVSYLIVWLALLCTGICQPVSSSVESDDGHVEAETEPLAKAISSQKVFLPTHEWKTIYPG